MWMVQFSIYYVLINNTFISLFLPVNNTFLPWKNSTISANFNLLVTSFHSASQTCLLSKGPVIHIHSILPALHQNAYLPNANVSLRMRRICLVKLTQVHKSLLCNFSTSPSWVVCLFKKFLFEQINIYLLWTH